ncbi:MAG: type II toxin-antitoxin system prevent-host-death family antitoxin [Verrucomicrobia bacterium]|nr:type II toxin-antitoxin system prevent-host-death family antitoxin [Verrucomicrobiota bacterium]
MRTITVRTLQHRLASVFNKIEDGEEISVTRNGRMVAKIVPLPKPHPMRWPDFMARLKKNFPDGPIKGDSQAFWDEMRKERF